MQLEPTLDSGVCATFSAAPPLPPGLKLDEKTGIIDGAPSEVAEKQTFTIAATNIAGSTSVELTFAVNAALKAKNKFCDEAYATKLEACTEVSELGPEPDKAADLPNWMVWMVHRAWVNDPSLTEFSFNNLLMPLPSEEPRISPKLVKAMAHNTYITSLQLANSNLFAAQGHELAESLQTNTTLQILNIDSNAVSIDVLKEIAKSLSDNEGSVLKEWKINNQRGFGSNYGAGFEEIIAQLVQTNTRIIKIGFAVQDPHWRGKIDQAILRNNDLDRRRRKAQAGGSAEVEVVEVALAKIELTTPPRMAVWELFPEDDVALSAARACVAKSKKMPSREQLQGFTKTKNVSLPYAKLAPLLKDVSQKLVSTAVNLEVSLTDDKGKTLVGTLTEWSEKNDRWSLDVVTGAGKRFRYTAGKAPLIETSGSFASWLDPDPADLETP